jgi:hypothetical protein
VPDPVSLCAEAAAAWHASWLTALGLRWARDDAVWQALERPPQIYFAGITLSPGATAGDVAGVPGSICDSWQALDLQPYGYRVWRTEPWFHRGPGPLPDEPAPPELEVVEVSTPDDVREFEAVSVRGFGDQGDTVPPGTFHPPTVLADAAMHMFLGRVDGQGVCAATGYRSRNVIGVFGVTTLASARRQGYGTAVTRAAMLVDTELPSILAPSPMGERLYRRPVGELSIWSPVTAAPAP